MKHSSQIAFVLAFALQSIVARADDVPAARLPAMTQPPGSPAREAADEPEVRSPTFGRPVFVAPESAFEVQVSLPRAAGAPLFELVCEADPARRLVLATPEEARERLPLGAPLALQVPAALPRATYDLIASWGGREVRARHCVAVGTIGDSIRLAHLSNMNLGDLAAPALDEQLIREINALGPTLIVATGDLLDAMHPDPAAGWDSVVHFLSRFDAPVLLARGDHDDPELYARLIAPSAVGETRVGRFRGIVLDDTPRLPLTQASEQVRWVERLLAEPVGGQTFIVSHDEHPGLLAAWRAQGTLSKHLRGGRIGLWLSGGHRDWDGLEYRGLVDAASPLLYVRTHQSSGALRDGASGIPHYRIIDVLPDRVEIPGEAASNGAPPASIPVGLIDARIEPTEASATERVLIAANRHAFSLTGLRKRVMLPCVGDGKPWCHGAQLASVTRLGAAWECTVRFDLPDKSALRARVGVGAEPSDPQPRVSFDLPSELVVLPQRSKDGVAYYRATIERGQVTIRNDGREAIELDPLIRLDGDRIGYRPADREMPFVTSCRLRIAPGQSATLRLDFSAIRLRPGRRELQVYAVGLPTLVPYTHALAVRIGR